MGEGWGREEISHWGFSQNSVDSIRCSAGPRVYGKASPIPTGVGMAVMMAWRINSIPKDRRNTDQHLEHLICRYK